MGNESGAWVDEEFESLDLGDPRRDRRAKELLKRFAALPTASIPGACDDWSQTIGAYRFLGNEQIDWRDVMQPHWERTAQRVAQFPVVLCIADTTELNFNGQEMDGLRPLSYAAQRGMFLHPTYAVTPDLEPLGVIDGGLGNKRTPMATGAGSRKAYAGLKGMNALRSKPRYCPRHGWSM
jgi:hypothetical protein